MMRNKNLIRGVSAFSALLCLYFGVSWYFSTQIVAFNVRSLEEDRKNLKINSVADFGLHEPESVSFQNPEDGTTLRGWYFKGERPCAAVFHHGYTGTRYGMLKYTPLLKDQRCHLLLYDARHHGESDGDYGTFGFYEKFDLLAAVDFLQKRTGVDDAHTALIGESYGAATVLQAAGHSRRRFWFLLAESPYSSLRRIVIEQAVQRYTHGSLLFTGGAFALAGLRARFDPDEVSPLRLAAYIETPVLIVHSRTDTYTVPEHSEEIASAMQKAGVPFRLLLTDWNSSHAKSIDDNFTEYNAAVQDFLREISKGQLKTTPAVTGI
jgi:dipeptidyl aminopeptidase/acylaminoacyl peptidase